MSQWGLRLKLFGADFVPLVESEPFQGISPESEIVAVKVLNFGEGDPEAVLHFQQEMVGQPYSCWLDEIGNQIQANTLRTAGFEAVEHSKNGLFSGEFSGGKEKGATRDA